MFRYEAPNPYKPSSFFSFFNFSSSSESIGRLVLPAQWIEPQTLSEMRLNQVVNAQDLVINGGYVDTHDDAVLDTIELKPKSECNKPLVSQHFIIKFNGNGMLYEDMLRYFAHDAHTLNATVVGFNYRGVGNSKQTPKTFQDLVTDGIAQVQRLLDSGVNSKKITLDGISLGGAVATMVANHFHNLDKPVYLWNDRSFASLSKAAAGMVAPKAGYIIGDAVATSFESTSWSIMKPSGWDVNVAIAYKAIPEKYKNHMYVAKESDHSNGDGLITHWASLHEGVKKEERSSGIKTGHKVYARHGLFGIAHNMPRNDLVSAENPSLSGQDQFEQFVRNHRF